MTDEELRAIRARANAATPGPWRVGTYGTCPYVKHWFLCNAGVHVDTSVPEKAADIEFIAAARSDVPALLAEVDRLQEQIDSLNDENFWRGS